LGCVPAFVALCSLMFSELKRKIVLPRLSQVDSQIHGRWPGWQKGWELTREKFLRDSF